MNLIHCEIKLIKRDFNTNIKNQIKKKKKKKELVFF